MRGMTTHCKLSSVHPKHWKARHSLHNFGDIQIQSWEHHILWWLIWYTLRDAFSIATTQLISLSPFRLVLSLAKRTKRRVVALSSCRKRITPNGALSWCRPVVCLISEYLISAELHCDIATIRRTTLFGLHRKRQDGKTKVRQRATQPFQFSLHNILTFIADCFISNKAR
jgi:hypothetical protein